MKEFMQKNILRRKITLFALIAILCFQMLAFLPIRARAADTQITSYDDTAIEDDLQHVDLSNYPANALGECDVISFMEYCYSENFGRSRYYALYLYVYNPTQKALTIADGYNFVNTVTGYDESGKAKFDKVNLEYLDKTNDNLFYKFKLSGSSQFLAMAQAYAKAHEGVRRYEIVELQVYHGADLSTSEVEKVYEWSGYAAYCAEDNSPISTLVCKDYGARSIHLNLKQTNYRFETQEDGYTKDELNSVFFTIPEEYFQDFGNLNTVSAEWYEYKTDYMFVTSDSEAYSGLWDMRGVLINEYGQLVTINEKGQTVIVADTQTYWRVLWEESLYSTSAMTSNVMKFGKAFNGKCREDINESYDFKLTSSCEYVNQFDWLFYVADVKGEDAYCVSKEDVMEYMRKYTNDFPDQERIRNRYASELFVSSIDSDRLQFLEDETATSGLVKMAFNVDSTKNEGNSFVDADSSQSWWNKFWFGTAYESVNYSPIAVIKEGDLVLDADTFAEKYYVNKKDVSDIMASAKEAYDNEERPVLLRFAVTDYYASTARFDYAEEDKFEMSDKDGYVAQETVFLDFDVISLGFKNEEGYNDVVIGVVAEPIDIINGLTPPDDLVEDQDWWQKIMMILLFIFLVVVLLFLFPIISPILGFVISGVLAAVKLVLKILLLPIRIITKPFRK